MVDEANVSAFNQDVSDGDGYQYTDSNRTSCRLSNRRLSEAVRSNASFEGKSVLDVGCGDGTYTMELLELGPSRVVGVDAAGRAIERARRKIPEGETRIRFETLSAYELETLGEKFDVAVVRGLLHHLYEPEKALASTLKVAKEVVVVEPNGYNLVLKIIEKTSRYHREHEERSFAPHQLRQWIGRLGGEVASGGYYGLVPFFCPDPVARGLKALEPFFERAPLVRALSCGVYVFRVKSNVSNA